VRSTLNEIIIFKVIYFSLIINRKFATTDGARSVWEARYIVATIDASPQALTQVDRVVRHDECVLRYFTVKHTLGLQRARTRDYRNPYAEKPEKKSAF
jgi:ribosomal protein S6